MYFVKWLQKTKMLTTFGGWSNSIVISMLVKSMCSNSKGMVAMMGCISILAASAPSCWMHHSQLLIAFCICMAMLGHQNWSCSKYRVHCWPWCPASQWHPFIATTSMRCGVPQTAKFLSACTDWCMAMLEGSLVECQLFLLSKDGHSLPQCSHYLLKDALDPVLSDWKSPQSMVLSIRSFCLSSCPISHMQVYTCMGMLLAWTTVSWTCLCISSSASATTGSVNVSLFLLIPQVTLSRMDFTVFFVELWCDLAQGIYSYIVLISFGIQC